MQVSEVPLYPAAGKLEHLFNFPRLHQVFLDFGLKKKKKRNLGCFNQTKPRKLSEFVQGWSPDC